ncbi:hypothetical protein MAR_007042 [Mya arenaria]|uniref:Uncharacterized protein n=1 Tax=Mya arenaria TaxID=6604 RepID=A0ABY7DC06_MYAAR|nr:hypothetical protein MAR_007042 [Mya arenaria]
MVNIVFQDGPLFNRTCVTLANIVMSAGMFTRLVSIRVMQARHSVDYTLYKCKIESEEDMRQMEVEMENQPGLQMVAPLPASPDYRAFISLSCTPISAGIFKRLVSMVIQARHDVFFHLDKCTIESEDDVMQMKMENQPGLQMVALLPASPGYTIKIKLAWMKVPAGMFKRLVSMMIQARHSVNCELGKCTIESDEDVRQMAVEMDNQPGLQKVAPLPASLDYTTHITLTTTTMAAGMLKRLVSMVIQARHSVKCMVSNCTIESEEDVRQMAVEMENQPGLQKVAPLPESPGYTKDITLQYTPMSAGMFKRLVSMVIQVRHSVNCTFDGCRIQSEEDVRQMKVRTENQPTLQMVDPLSTSPDYTAAIRLLRLTVSAGMFKHLVSMVIQARHSVNCTLEHCTIQSEEDVRQMTAETENQPALQMVDPLSATSDYTTNITLTRVKVSAGILRRLVSMVIQARHSVNCTLSESTIEEDIRQIKEEIENQPLLKVREFSERYSQLWHKLEWFIRFTVNM